MNFSTFSSKQGITDNDNLIALCIASAGFFHGFHFITKSYSAHKTFDTFYEKMPDVIDTYAEMYLGDNRKYTPPTSIPFYSDPKALLTDIESLVGKVYAKSSSAEQSCLDDIMTLCRQTRYMLTLQ
ncbi:starvation-inducible transcriptional regulator [Serratia phage 92A1]|nr:starvation-inducible transcriptional regulator [Serratia phage 92A1]